MLYLWLVGVLAISVVDVADVDCDCMTEYCVVGIVFVLDVVVIVADWVVPVVVVDDGNADSDDVVAGSDVVVVVAVI